MSYTGKVQNGVVVLPPEARLPDGTEVEVVLPSDRSPTFCEGIQHLIKDRDWPADFELNHAHYAKGHPKK